MRSGLLLALAGLGVGFLPSLFGFVGCSGDDSNGGDGGEASSGVEDPSEEGPDYCDFDAFFRVDGNGGACSPIAPNKPCFVECEAGGCYCVAGPEGTGIWQCQVDTSCLPKCAPDDLDCSLDGSTFDDTGPIPEAAAEPPLDGSADAQSPDTTSSSDAGEDDGDAPDDVSEAAAADAATLDVVDAATEGATDG
jgi:hypothetical protein